MSFSSTTNNKKFSERFGKVLSSNAGKKLEDQQKITTRGTTDLKHFLSIWSDIENMTIGKLKFNAMSKLCALSVLPFGEVPGKLDTMDLGIKEHKSWTFVITAGLDGYVIRMIPNNHANKNVRKEAVRQCLKNLCYNPDFEEIFIEVAGDLQCDLKLLEEACKVIFDNKPNLFLADSLKHVNANICEMKEKWEQKQTIKAANKKFEESTTVGSLFGDILDQVKTC